MTKGEVTAYLSLIFILLLSFVGSVMGSASIQMAKSYRRADLNRALESVFAEYQKELLEEYDIFALEGGYESGDYAEEKLIERLEFYGASDMEQAVTKIEFLTDHGAKAFYEQVAAFMEHKYGLDLFQDKVGMTDVWRQQEEKAEEYESEEKRQQDELEQLLTEEEGELPQQDNPIAHVDNLKNSPLLDLIIPRDKQVSGKAVHMETLASVRTLNQGYGDFSEESQDAKALTSLLFGEYILEHFDYALSEESEGSLDYELEYILAGKASDAENLEAVAKKLLLLRFVPNYAYLQGSGAKKAEAEAMALTVCALLAVPAITQAVTQGILLAWAYGESIMDLRSLLGDHKVPLVKSDESWQLSLAGLMKLGESGEFNDGKDCSDGLAYKDYLRMLLFLEKKERLGLRALDMIEQNLRSEHSLSFFRADHCISKIQLHSICRLRRGVTYDFKTYFGYR